MKQRQSFWVCLMLSVFLVFAVCSIGFAADWPKKAVQIIVPFKAGGDSDFNARTYAKYLEKELGESVIVVNVEGGGGSIGATKAKESKADGYTVFLGDVALALNEAAGLIDFGYNAYDTGCICGKNAGEFITVRSDMPVKNIKELIALTQKEPNKYKLAANTGATTHYAASVLKKLGAKFNVVNSGSSAERVAALKGKHVDVIINSMGSIKSYIANGDFKILANTAETRAKYYPDYKTCKEQGVKLGYTMYYNFLWPKGTNKAIITKFNDAVKKVIKNPEYAKDIKQAYGQEPFFVDGAAATAMLKADHDRYMAFKNEFSTGK